VSVLGSSFIPPGIVFFFLHPVPVPPLSHHLCRWALPYTTRDLAPRRPPYLCFLALPSFCNLHPPSSCPRVPSSPGHTSSRSMLCLCTVLYTARSVTHRPATLLQSSPNFHVLHFSAPARRTARFRPFHGSSQVRGLKAAKSRVSVPGTVSSSTSPSAPPSFVRRPV